MQRHQALLATAFTENYTTKTFTFTNLNPQSPTHHTCIGPSPPLADIVFWAFYFGLPLKIFKTLLLGRGFNTLIKGVSSPTQDVGSHNPPPSGPSVLVSTRSFLPSTWDHHQIHPLRGPTSLSLSLSLLAHRLMSTPFGEQPPRWHIARCLALIPFVTAQAHR